MQDFNMNWRKTLKKVLRSPWFQKDRAEVAILKVFMKNNIHENVTEPVKGSSINDVIAISDKLFVTAVFKFIQTFVTSIIDIPSSPPKFY